jgi:hypothetical protein
MFSSGCAAGARSAGDVLAGRRETPLVAKLKLIMKDEMMNEHESGKPEFPILLGGGEVQVVEYTVDQRRAVELLKDNGLLADYDRAMQRVGADIDCEPGSVQAWIDILSVKGQLLMLAATMIYLPDVDGCLGAIAVARYVGKLKRARAVLYRWAEKNATQHVEKLVEGAVAGAELN